MAELPKNYDPKAIEEKWLQRWLDEKTHHVTPQDGGEPYTIVIPPPNVTGILHMGHALNNTIQDVLIRWQRMKGRNALWVPGTDHAGIATQNVVERALKKAEGKRRQDLGREEFVKRVWAWKEEYGNTIVKQLKRLGTSCDWERERFTMDAGLSNAVAETFVRLYHKGLIYRGEYIINWCPRCQTALSDEESEHRDMNGHLYHLRYPVKDEPGRFVVVATTRPETFLGDVAVAVNPKDERYQSLIGKMLVLPVLHREIPVIADDFVDPKFGTGCVKVTPAHDPNDFQMGQRHALPMINVMTDDGHMNENAGPYQGVERFVCRKRIMDDLAAAGLVEKTEDHQNAVGHCYRCSSVVEPRLSKQWFVRMQPLAAPCIEAAKQGKIEFIPEHWNKVYLNWMEGIRDWCISRQLWWGHRVPVYYDLSKLRAAVETDTRRRGTETDASRAAASGLPLPELLPVALRTIADDLIRDLSVASKDDLAAREPGRYVQDPDVLDTWASSWLWPFSVFGWPEQTDDLKFYYPTNTLVTASEIIFFWVARMIMAGCEFMGEVPFNKIYIHGTVRDDQGRKMSKSLGNSIDPLDIIADYSADALRFSLMMLTATGQDVYISKEKFELGRNFGTKIWNAARFIQMHKVAEPIDIRAIKLNPGNWTSDDWHIIGKVEDAWKACEDCLEKCRFNDYAHVLYEFFWHEYCDWYVEYAKDVLYSTDEVRRAEVLKVMHYVFDRALRLLHPLMPYLTEELWHGMGYGLDDENIAFAAWPDASRSQLRNLAQGHMEYVDAKHEIIGCGRKLRADFEIAPSQKVDIVIKPHNEDEAKALRADARAIAMMLKAQNLTIDPAFAPAQAMPSSLGKLGTIYMGLGADVDAKAEVAKLQKQIEQIDNALRGITAKLGNPNFLQRAKPEVVEAEKARHTEYTEKRDKLTKIIASLGG